MFACGSRLFPEYPGWSEPLLFAGVIVTTYGLSWLYWKFRLSRQEQRQQLATDCLREFPAAPLYSEQISR